MEAASTEENSKVNENNNTVKPEQLSDNVSSIDAKSESRLADELEMNAIRELPITVKELTFRQMLPTIFTNGIQSALRHYNFATLPSSHSLPPEFYDKTKTRGWGDLARGQIQN